MTTYYIAKQYFGVYTPQYKHIYLYNMTCVSIQQS